MPLFNRKKSQENTAFAFETDDTGLCVFDKNGRILQANEAATVMFGYNSSAALIGGDILNVIHLVGREDLKISPGNQILETAIKSATPLKSRDYLVVPENGKPSIPVEFSLIPNTAKDETAAFLFKLRDIEKDLERERIQSDFISVASHEMRTPIAAIEGYLSLALNPKVSTIDAGARGCIESAYKSTKYLGSLFRNLLDVTRLDEEKYQPELISLEVCQFLKQLSGTYEMLAKNNNRVFRLRVPNEEFYAYLDSTLLEEVITNLVDNAIKYTKENGEITLSVHADNSRVYIDVSDNGIGISKENLANIFDKFFRVESGTSEIRGAGLGLYLVKRRLNKMRGEISVTSEKGKGSTFSLSFPRISTEFVVNSPEKKPQTVSGIAPLTKEEFAAADPFSEDMKKVLRYPLVPPEVSAFPFINLSERWRNGEIPSSTEEEKQKVYEAIRNYNKDVPDEQFNKVWDQFRPRLENPGLIKILNFMIKSSFCVPWMLVSPTAPSWEISFGWGYDFNGNWREIPKDDYMYTVSLRDPEFIWGRERAILARREIADKQKVLFLNAGCLPELRHLPSFGFPKEIWACDEQNNIDPENIFGWISSNHNVHYSNANIFDYLDNAGKEGALFDTIIMNGATINYYTEIDRIINSAVKLLKPSGKFLFDIQLPHWDLVRANLVFGIYPEIASLPFDFDDAVSNIQKICSKIWNVNVSYVADSRNKEPVGIMFCITNNE